MGKVPLFAKEEMGEILDLSVIKLKYSADRIGFGIGCTLKLDRHLKTPPELKKVLRNSVSFI